MLVCFIEVKTNAFGWSNHSGHCRCSMCTCQTFGIHCEKKNMVVLVACIAGKHPTCSNSSLCAKLENRTDDIVCQEKCRFVNILYFNVLVLCKNTI